MFTAASLARRTSAVVTAAASRRSLVTATRNVVASQRKQLRARQQQLRNGSDMPLPQSSQAKLFEGHKNNWNEGWETTIAWWYSSSLVLILMVWNAPPETSISAWASREALARLKLKESGAVETFEFGKHYQDVPEAKLGSDWDGFSQKALRMDDDDDDDDDDDEDEDDEE